MQPGTSWQYAFPQHLVFAWTFHEMSQEDINTMVPSRMTLRQIQLLTPLVARRKVLLLFQSLSSTSIKDKPSIGPADRNVGPEHRVKLDTQKRSVEHPPVKGQLAGFRSKFPSLPIKWSGHQNYGKIPSHIPLGCSDNVLERLCEALTNRLHQTSLYSQVAVFQWRPGYGTKWFIF